MALGRIARSAAKTASKAVSRAVLKNKKAKAMPQRSAKSTIQGLRTSAYQSAAKAIRRTNNALNTYDKATGNKQNTKYKIHTGDSSIKGRILWKGVENAYKNEEKHIKRYKMLGGNDKSLKPFYDEYNYPKKKKKK